MCTVTIVPHGEGFRVMCNRDERRTRPAALPPRLQRLGARRAAFPLDPLGGGTWIGVNDAGVALALLNRTPSRPVAGDARAPARPRSRGSIVRKSLEFGSAEAVVDLLARLDITEFEPFRLVIIDAPTVIAAASDGARLDTTRLTLTQPMLFSSSSLGDAVVDRPRRKLFERMVVHAAGRLLAAQARFHRHQAHATADQRSHGTRGRDDGEQDVRGRHRTRPAARLRVADACRGVATEAHVLLLTLMVGTLISEDLACVTAGLLIREGRVAAGPAVLACSLGILLGDIGLWGLGRMGTRVIRLPAMARWLERAGVPAAHACALGWENVAAAIVASRFLPGTRLPLYLAAGATGLPLRTFALWSAVAVALWTPTLVLFSSYVGELIVALIVVKLALGSRRLALRIERWRRWEFWPMWLFYAPVAVWILWLSLRYRGISTITTANPGMPDGGTVGESKFQILSRLPPDAIIPSALIIPGNASERAVHALDVMRQRGWSWPLVLKPDVGQRGVGVKLARTEAELAEYLARQERSVLMQPYHAGPFEAGVFYYRFPGWARGQVLSITDKYFPFVVGDGRSTLEELIVGHQRYRLQADTFLARHHDALSLVPEAGRRVALGLAGNHAQGTMFRDGSHLWTAALERRIDDIARAYPGFYVGRFDVRYEDVDAFKEGRGLAIVELNGATAESTDIYDPDRSLLGAYRRLFQQWSIVFAIGAANRAAGAPGTPTRRLIELVRAHLAYKPAFELSD